MYSYKESESDTVTPESAKWKTLNTIRCQRVVWDCFCISLKTNRTPVTQELYLDEETMPHVYVFVSCIYRSYTRSFILMRKQCLTLMLLLAASMAVTQGVVSWWENNESCLCYCWPHLRQIIFVPHEKQIGRHLHKDSSLDEKTMPRVYVIVSRIWAHWEKSIENKISKRYCRVVQTYCLGRAPTNLQNVSHLSNNHLFLPHMLLCGLGVYTWAATTLDEIAVYS